MYTGNVQLLFDLQQLVGALLGVLFPILFWFFTQWFIKKREYREALELMEKNAVLSLNNANEIRKTINIFLEKSLQNIIKNIDNDTKAKRYSLAVAFFPFFNAEPINQKIIDLKTKSNYLNNQVLSAYLMSKDFVHILDDIRRQFDWTLQINKETAVNKLNSSKYNNMQYKDNIEEFHKMVQEDFLKKSVENYFEILIKLIAGTRAFQRMNFYVWRHKFSSYFRFFIKKSGQKKYDKEAFDQIYKLLKSKEEKDEYINTLRALNNQTKFDIFKIYFSKFRESIEKN